MRGHIYGVAGFARKQCPHFPCTPLPRCSTDRPPCSAFGTECCGTCACNSSRGGEVHHQRTRIVELPDSRKKCRHICHQFAINFCFRFLCAKSFKSRTIWSGFSTARLLACFQRARARSCQATTFAAAKSLCRAELRLSLRLLMRVAAVAALAHVRARSRFLKECQDARAGGSEACKSAHIVERLIKTT